MTRCSRGGGRLDLSLFVHACLADRARRDTADEEADDDGKHGAGGVDDDAGTPGCGALVRQGTDVNESQRAGDDPDERVEEVRSEANAGETEGVVERAAGETHGQANQKRDLATS